MDNTISLLVDFKVKIEHLEQSMACIKKFLNAISKNEQGSTLLYKSFQHKQDPLTFYHVMTFKDKSAQKTHQTAKYTDEFVAELYPLCEREPNFTEITELE